MPNNIARYDGNVRGVVWANANDWLVQGQPVPAQRRIPVGLIGGPFDNHTVIVPDNVNQYMHEGFLYTKRVFTALGMVCVVFVFNDDSYHQYVQRMKDLIGPVLGMTGAYVVQQDQHFGDS